MAVSILNSDSKFLNSKSVARVRENRKKSENFKKNHGSIEKILKFRSRLGSSFIRSVAVTIIYFYYYLTMVTENSGYLKRKEIFMLIPRTSLVRTENSGNLGISIFSDFIFVSKIRACQRISVYVGGAFFL